MRYNKLGWNYAIITNFCVLFTLPYVIWFSLISTWYTTEASVGLQSTDFLVPLRYIYYLQNMQILSRLGAMKLWLRCQLPCILLFTCRIDNLIQMSRWNHRTLLCHLDQVSDNYYLPYNNYGAIVFFSSEGRLVYVTGQN